MQTRGNPGMRSRRRRKMQGRGDPVTGHKAGREIDDPTNLSTPQSTVELRERRTGPMFPMKKPIRVIGVVFQIDQVGP